MVKVECMSEDFDSIKQSEGIGDADIPDNPGPAALGHTPLIGSLRRGNDIPVVRERVVEEVDELENVDLPDEPVLGFLD
jgi:hypothetical protein